MVDAVVTCPGCGITVFASSDNTTGYCTGCTKAGKVWTACAERSTERYEVEINVASTSQLADQRYRYRVRKEHRYDPDRPWWNGLPRTDGPIKSSRVDTEINHGWMRNNPELAVDTITRFQEEHPITEWKHFTHMGRKGFLKLIAVRRTEAYDPDRDYLKEIGYQA